MKRIFALGFAVMMLATPAVYAGTASEDLADVIENTKAFDGGDGSTINTSVE